MITMHKIGKNYINQAEISHIVQDSREIGGKIEVRYAVWMRNYGSMFTISNEEMEEYRNRYLKYTEKGYTEDVF